MGFYICYRRKCLKVNNMKNLIVGALIIGAILITKKGFDMSRGIRNNNPGNIRKSKDAWEGLKATQTDNAFFQFTDAKYGIRAIGKILINYQKKYGINTVSGIINRWAPAIENNTASYINHISSLLKVAPDEPINVNDTETLVTLINGIIKHENGINPYSDKTVREGVALI